MYSMDEYKILADIYDILNPKEDVYLQRPFFDSLVEKYNVGTVLDCACGTGIHLSLFHEMGLRASGSDISGEMLKIAAENTNGLHIPLKQQDFRELQASWSEKFDMVTCLTTSLPYMLTQEDLHTALQSMYDALNPGGVLVITNGITDSLLDTKPKFIPARINQNDAFYFICDYTDTTMTFNILYVKHGDTQMEHAFTSTTYNAMRKSVISSALTTVPFRDISYFGDYAFQPYDEHSSANLIIVAQK